MCEKRISKIKRGSHVARLREARRLQRLHWITTNTPAHELTAPRPPPPPQQPTPEKTAKSRVILELALKTILLMQKNKQIQQKIIALQKETSEFVAAIMSNPESKRRYLEHVRLYAAGLITLVPSDEARNKPLKVEPKS